MNGAVNDFILNCINYFNALLDNDLIQYLICFYIAFCVLGLLRRLFKLNS